MHSSHPTHNTHIFLKTKSRADLEIIIKVTVAFGVLNIYPSVYSMFLYMWCSSYLLMHNKSPKNLLAYNNGNHYVISRGFYGAGIWVGLS